MIRKKIRYKSRIHKYMLVMMGYYYCLGIIKNCTYVINQIKTFRLNCKVILYYTKK